jgi:hypothetical protein
MWFDSDPVCGFINIDDYVFICFGCVVLYVVAARNVISGSIAVSRLDFSKQYVG